MSSFFIWPFPLELDGYGVNALVSEKVPAGCKKGALAL